MWGALSRLFVKSENPSLAEEAAEDCSGNFGDVDEQQQLQEIMEKQAIATATLKHQDMDTLESKQARQRASVKWILSKSFNNRVPENLKEPFYRDHEGQEHLKPQIVVGFGNATLYCQTLSNLYSDPNYQSLNHWSILQTLTRKGVPVGETADVPLTETVLIQTNPLRINAHMCVIEALMILYAKEVATSDRISSAIGRISGGVLPKDTVHHESALLYWISHACAALKKRINQEIESGAIDENGVRLQTPDIPSIRDYRDLCDGVCLAFLISYYCPKVVPWTSVRVNYLPTVEDSIFNVLLVNNFSQKHLPYSVFHMTPQDITYMRGSMKQNLVVLLADFFNLFEIHPAKCVCYPGMEQQETDTDNSGSNEHGIAHRRGLTCQPVTPIPDLRSGVDSPSSSSCSPNNTRPPFQVTRSASASTMRKPTPPRDVPAEQQQQQQQQMGTDEGFVVHRGRAITTLASLHHHQQQQQQQKQEPLVPARLRQAKEKSNNDSKAEERGDNMAAGRPSNWEDTRRPSYAGRRSRRNSFSEDSQLTIENFGGSQDQLNQIGRTMERERKFSNSTINNVIEQAVAVRSSIADARGTLQLGYDNDSGSEKQDRETEKTTLRRQTSMDNVSLRNIITHSKEKDTTDGDITQSHRNLSIHNNASTSSVIATAAATIATEEDTSKRKTSFASTLPNTTTWQQQSANFQQLDNDVDDERPLVDATKLTTIRMKLEEKRRHIEQEKRKMEFALSKQQQKVGKAAFLQAINKGKTHNQTDLSEKKETTISSHDVVDRNPPERPCSLQDLADINNIESKWDSQIESKKTPEIDHMDIDQYQQSIAIMNCSLKDIQQDIHRLTNQQSQMQAQHIQAQQLLQAQQIANMINQQQYGSQQHIPGQYRNTQQQPQLPHNFGSTPHLTQQQQHLYNSQPQRPPSRDPHQQQPLQYINDQGQYMTTPQPLGNNIQSNSREHSPYLSENGGQYQQYGGNDSPYNQHQYSDSNQYQTYRAEQQQYRDEYESSSPKSNQFYLHDTPPQPPARRTWAQTAVNSQPQQQQQSPLDLNAWSQNSPRVDTRTWKSPQSPALNQSGGNGGGGGGFMLHQNGNNDYDKPDKSYPNLFPVHESPQHTRVHRQISQLMSSGGNQSNELQKQHADNHRVPMTPAIDDMAPQSISFIGDEDSVEHPPPPQISGGDRYLQQLHQPQHYPTAAGNGGAPTLKQHPQQNSSAAAHYDQQELDLGKLNITSGKLTYRIPSPTRPSLNLNSFQDPNEDSVNNEQKGFYIAFDNAQPKRPKPPLRTKRSPKKERSIDDITSSSNNHNSKQEQIYQLEKELDKERQNILHDSQQPQQHKANKLNSNNSSSNLFSDHRGGAGDDYNNSPFSNNKNYNRSGSGGGGGGIDEPIIRRHVSDNQMASILDRRHLEDVTNYPQSTNNSSSNDHHRPRDNKTLIIDDELTNIDPDSVDEMERKKEKIMLLSLQRRQQQEETKARKEIDAMQRREKEREKEEERIRKREEQVARRAAILEQHKFKKAIEEAEQKGLTIDRNDMLMMKQQLAPSASAAKLRTNKVVRPRPKTIHVETGSVDLSEVSSLGSRNKKGSNSNLTGIGHLSSNSMRRDYYRGSQDSLAIRESPDEYPSTSSTPIGRRGSYKNTTREPTGERGRTMSRISVAKGSNLNFRGRKSNSLMNLCDTDSGLGRATPPRRAPSPGMGPSGRHLPSPSGPGSLPPGFMNKRRIFDDGSSDISSAASSMMEYSGPKLYKQPATKSNRGIILNAVEYCVFPGVVNRDAKQKVLEKIARSEAKHFLVLFRDAGCQFRALYSYWPENETVLKLFGTGPSQVDEFMFDKFFKYNSGGKCFSQVHTKHLTVTIDAFTIHNSLWQGKKVAMPSKKDMALVI